ncbi:3-hydroxyacyl-CoA dehydrogenase NAD-binding domain-containing protein [Streptomyces sp. NPDC059787]|uniref:3-hydroxyacyl-CoA dehydrogenase NAD-binding domain-containing protein n=1 Tax=Streptomyces sp. NPDC059787 TaxID=3346947 RepID=UPI0036540474
MPEKNMIHWEQGSDGVVVLTVDDSDQPVNTMNQTHVDSMEATVARLEAERQNITGVVLASAKKSFFAGGDMGFMSKARPENAGELSELCTVLKSQLRRLETLGRPVAAAMNGTALGGGFEIALAGHRRIALDAPGSRFGLPEVPLGLLPGAGGVSRTVRLLGLQEALTDVLLKGKQYKPQEALAKGLVHEIAQTPEETLTRARQWVLAHPEATQPWDAEDFRIPGGAPSHPKVAAILPTADPADLSGCDLVIEAVFEDPDLKQRVFHHVEDVVAPDAVLGSNTSTLPITGLAKGLKRPEDFIGLHFFSPVDKMPLLEIIVGERTGEHTVAKAIDIARQIGKTPIVVDDSRGFFTSRVISEFIDEAVAMIGEGLSPASVEQAGSQAGHPAPPPQLLDELPLTLPRKIREETRTAVLAEGGQWHPHGSEPVVDRMIDEFGRGGRSSGAGFHEYADGRRTRLWRGLYEHFAVPGREIPFEDMKERMLFAEALDTVRCLDEGVLRSVPDANAGSILGIGFPAWTGGVLQYINGYPGGLHSFVTRARELAERYGERFEPPVSLVAKAGRGERYE